MKLCKLIQYDFVNGIWRRWFAYAGIGALYVAVFLDFYFRILQYKEGNSDLEDAATALNFLFYILEGKEPFTPDLLSNFVFPVGWMLIFLSMGYLTLEYPLRNLTSHGTQVVIRTKNRMAWWFSKCLWIILSALLCFGILILTLQLMCLLTGVDSSLLRYSAQINEIGMGLQFADTLDIRKILTLTFILPRMTVVAIGMIQLCLSLFFKRIYCFLATAVLLLASTYYQSPVAIGNFAMMQRSVYANPEGVGIGQGMILNGFIIVVALAVGLWKINRHDILDKG